MGQYQQLIAATDNDNYNALVCGELAPRSAMTASAASPRRGDRRGQRLGHQYHRQHHDRHPARPAPRRTGPSAPRRSAKIPYADFVARMKASGGDSLMVVKASGDRRLLDPPPPDEQGRRRCGPSFRLTTEGARRGEASAAVTELCVSARGLMRDVGHQLAEQHRARGPRCLQRSHSSSRVISRATRTRPEVELRRRCTSRSFQKTPLLSPRLPSPGARRHRPRRAAWRRAASRADRQRADDADLGSADLPLGQHVGQIAQLAAGDVDARADILFMRRWRQRGDVGGRDLPLPIEAGVEEGRRASIFSISRRIST